MARKKRDGKSVRKVVARLKRGYYFCLSSSGVSFKTQFDNRNMIMGINTDHFERYKDSYAGVLKACDLFEGEDNLYKLV